MVGWHPAYTWVMIQAELPALTGQSLGETLAPRSLSSPSLPKAKPPVCLPKCSNWAKKDCPSPLQCGTNWHLGGTQKRNMLNTVNKSQGKTEDSSSFEAPNSMIFSKATWKKVIVTLPKPKAEFVGMQRAEAQQVNPACSTGILIDTWSCTKQWSSF